MMSNDGHTFTARPSFVRYTPHAFPMCGCPATIFLNGVLYVAYSQGIDLSWVGTTIEIAKSTDGDNFTYVTTVDYSDVVSGPDAEVWSDAWYLDDDGSVYLIVCGSSDKSNHTTSPDWQEYFKKALSPDLTSWSASTRVTGTGLPPALLSPAIIKQAGVYTWFVKNEVSECVEVMQSTSFASGYTMVKTGDWAGWGVNYEAPRLINLGGNSWRIYLDPLGGGMRYSETSSGLLSGWSHPAVSVTAPISLQHGDILANPFGH